MSVFLMGQRACFDFFKLCGITEEVKAEIDTASLTVSPAGSVKLGFLPNL